MRRKLEMFATGLSLLCVGLACGDQSKQGQTPGGATTSTPTPAAGASEQADAASPIPATSPLDKLALKKALGDMTQDEWTAFTKDLPFTNADKDGALPPDGSVGCNISDQPVTITPTTDSYKLVHGDEASSLDKNPNGFVVAKIENTGTCGTGFIKIPQKGHVFWVVRRKAGAYVSTFVDDAKSQQGNLTFAYCRHTKDHNKDEAHVKTVGSECNDDIKAKAKAVHSALKKRDPNDDPSVWMACSQDCCYTDGGHTEKGKGGG